MWVRTTQDQWWNLDNVVVVKRDEDGTVRVSFVDDSEAFLTEEMAADLIHHLMTEAMDCRKPEDRC